MSYPYKVTGCASRGNHFAFVLQHEPNKNDIKMIGVFVKKEGDGLGKQIGGRHARVNLSVGIKDQVVNLVTAVHQNNERVSIVWHANGQDNLTMFRIAADGRETIEVT